MRVAVTIPKKSGDARRTVINRNPTNRHRRALDRNRALRRIEDAHVGEGPGVVYADEGRGFGYAAVASELWG
jgi:hypothetical protein